MDDFILEGFTTQYQPKDRDREEYTGYLLCNYLPLTVFLLSTSQSLSPFKDYSDYHPLRYRTQLYK